jgi:hypothetical protein
VDRELGITEVAWRVKINSDFVFHGDATPKRRTSSRRAVFWTSSTMKKSTSQGDAEREQSLGTDTVLKVERRDSTFSTVSLLSAASTVAKKPVVDDLRSKAIRLYNEVLNEEIIYHCDDVALFRSTIERHQRGDEHGGQGSSTFSMYGYDFRSWPKGRPIIVRAAEHGRTNIIHCLVS